MRGVAHVFLRRLIFRDRFEHELTDELEFHLDARIADLQQRGLNPAEACRRSPEPRRSLRPRCRRLDP